MSKRTGTGGLAAATFILLILAILALVMSASAGGIDGLTVVGLIAGIVGIVTGARVAARWGATLDAIHNRAAEAVPQLTDAH